MSTPRKPPPRTHIPFHVGPWVYYLRISPDPVVNELGRELMGRSLYQSREILISPGVPPDHRFEVLLHELRHCWGFHFPKPRTEEEEADLTASIVGQVMQDLERHGGAGAIARMGQTDGRRLDESPAPPSGLSQIPFHVGPFTYHLVISENRLYLEGAEVEGLAVEGRRLLILSSAVEPDRREEIAFHEFMHGWEFHVPRPKNNEERCQLSAMVCRQFREDLAAVGGPQALLDLQSMPIPPLGNPTKEWLNPTLVAQSLSVDAATVRRLIRAGELPAITIGSGSRPRYRVASDALERFLEVRTVRPVGNPVSSSLRLVGT